MLTPARWEIFCRVIDNYGDIGVCWRLARQLVREHGASVRVWLDSVATLAPLVGGLAPDAPVQQIEGIELRAWTEDPGAELAAWPEVVIEGFGCGLPEGYLDALQAPERAPLWIVLEYLSAEPWVAAHHGLASPPPRHRLRRFFFFPGFGEDTGGLLREADLPAAGEAVEALVSTEVWARRALAPPDPDTFSISVFAYADAPLERWADELMSAGGLPGAFRHARLALAPGALSDRLGAQGQRVPASVVEVVRLPFVCQTEFDELLRVCQFNVVRGEDSFLRAQWAGRPFVWHIYPQAGDEHLVKLEAFLDRYCADMPQPLAGAVRDLWRAFNARPPVPLSAWTRAMSNWSGWEAHARQWAWTLASSSDMTRRLIRFCAERL